MKTPWQEEADQHAALCIIGYLEDLFTASRRDSFTKIDILALLNMVKNDPELFELEAVIAYDQVSKEVEE